jgi:cephalosporin-C deacetylase
LPLIDLPLEKLYQYKGLNPKPQDFDNYWSIALDEMRAVKADIEIVPSEFQVPFADCFDLYFTGVRGARIHVKYVRPKHTAASHPAVIQFHGYTMNAGDWNDKLIYASLGYSVFALDVRGQGGASEDTGGVKGNTLRGHIIRGLDSEDPHDLLFRHIFLDTAQLAGIAMDMPEVDPNRIGAMGWSQGGALTIACAALEPRIRRLTPVYPFLSDYQRVWEMDLAKDAYDELRKYFRFFDPEHKRQQDIFTKLGYIDIQHLANRIKGEVLMGVGLSDTVCPPSSQFAAYNKINSAKQLKIYPDYAHEHLPGFNDAALQFMLKL